MTVQSRQVFRLAPGDAAFPQFRETSFGTDWNAPLDDQSGGSLFGDFTAFGGADGQDRFGSMIWIAMKAARSANAR